MTGGWETWEWDDSLFAGAAPYYERGRIPYAPGLADTLADELGLDGTGRLLDVGCGPGIVALRVAHLFDEVVGLDPDAGMLAAAADAARARGISNVRWVQGRAESLPGDLGRFRVIAFAASFHWMDRPRVAGAVATMLEADGAVVQIGAPPETLTPAPDAAIERVRQRWLGPDKRAGQSIRNTSPDGEDTVFQGAGFLPMREVFVPDGRVLERTIDDLVAQRLSSSGTAPHLFGDRVREFESDLRQALAEVADTFTAALPDNSIRIWRLPS